MPGKFKEFELKFDLAEDKLVDVAAAAASERFAAAKPQREQVLSIYYDTSTHALRDAASSLRLRRSGKSWVQTVKLGTSVQAGVSNPMEIEAPVPCRNPRPDLIPNAKARKKLLKLIGDDKLKPVFRTDVMRTTHRLKALGSKVELALDSGTIQDGAATAAICEAELELKAGSASALLDIARHLLAGVPFTFGTHNKAERGYWLATAGRLPDCTPVKASASTVHPKLSVAEAFARISQSAGEQILANWRGIQIGDDPEFAHQMRVGIRRLRTALRVFEGAIDTPALRTLTRDLGRLGRQVGELRDADVLLADIAHPVLQSAQTQNGAHRLEALLRQHDVAVREHVRGELRKTGWNAVMLHIALLPHGAGWSDKVKAGGKIKRYALKALKACWKPVARRARQLNELTTEERHSLRKDLKKLRYALEFFQPVLPPARSLPFIERLKELQDSFGYLNDVALAQTLPTITAGPAGKPLQLDQSVRKILDWHNRNAEEAWRNTQQQWHRLKQQPKPWV